MDRNDHWQMAPTGVLTCQPCVSVFSLGFSHAQTQTQTQTQPVTILSYLPSPILTKTGRQGDYEFLTSISNSQKD